MESNHALRSYQERVLPLNQQPIEIRKAFFGGLYLNSGLEGTRVVGWSRGWGNRSKGECPRSKSGRGIECKPSLS